MKKWLNLDTGKITNSPQSGIDYGFQHFQENGREAVGMSIIDREAKRSPLIRDRFLETHGLSSAKIDGGLSSWSAPTFETYVSSALILRKFYQSDYIGKNKILLEILGFDDSGVAIGNAQHGFDQQYFYKYSTEPSQIELYISRNPSNHITEINRFNNLTMDDIKIPIDLNGMHYTIMQVMTDSSMIDFGKLTADSFSQEEWMFVGTIMDINFSIPELDNADISDIIG
jgi:hypothetical protein